VIPPDGLEGFCVQVLSPKSHAEGTARGVRGGRFVEKHHAHRREAILSGKGCRRNRARYRLHSKSQTIARECSLLVEDLAGWDLLRSRHELDLYLQDHLNSNGSQHVARELIARHGFLGWCHEILV